MISQIDNISTWFSYEFEGLTIPNENSQEK